MEDNFVLNK